MKGISSTGTIRGLTARQSQILHLVAAGLQNGEIAKRLNISVKTVGKYLGHFEDASIYDRIRAANRAEAIRWYFEQQSASAFEKHIELVRDYTKRIYAVRVQGSSTLAIDMASSLERMIREIAQEYDDGETHRHILRLLGPVLFEKGWALSEVSSRESDSYGAEETAATLADVAATCRDNELGGLAEMFIGDAQYVQGDHGEAAKNLKKALGNVHTLEYRLMLLHTVGVNAAILGEENYFSTIESEIRNMVQDTGLTEENGELACHMLLGITRGQGILRLPTAFETLEEAKTVYRHIEVRNERAPLRATQLARGELELARNFGERIRTLEAVGKEGARLAKEHRYQRMENQINELLLTLLN